MNEETIAGLPKPLPNNYVCDKCDKTFQNEKGLRMHEIRKHSGKGWSTTGNLAKRKAYKKQYDLRKKAEKMRGPMTVPDSINFCPECGCNLQVYKVAWAAAKRVNENA